MPLRSSSDAKPVRKSSPSSRYTLPPTFGAPLASQASSSTSSLKTGGRKDPQKWKDPYASVLRRKWVLFETTFALNLFEPWEKAILLSIFAVIFVLLALGVSRIPRNVIWVSERAAFYLFGNEKRTT